MAANKFISGFIGGKTVLRVSSPFGAWRKTYAHDGIDIAVPSGTLLRAPIDGYIFKSNVSGRGGLTVTIKIDLSNQTLYFSFMHLHSSSVKEGQYVKAGDVIGTTGGLSQDKPNCGHSTGAHLH